MTLFNLLALAFFHTVLVGGHGTVPPQEVYNTVHLSFPKDRMAAWNLNQLAQRYGISTDYSCSSFIGPQCASQKTIELLEMLSDKVEDDVWMASFTEQEQPVALLIFNDGSKKVVKRIKVSDDLLQDFGQVTIDPDWIGALADSIADTMGLQDKEAYKQRIINNIATLVAKEPNGDGSNSSSAKKEDKNKLGIIDLSPVTPPPDHVQAQFVDWSAKVVVDEVSQMLGSQQKQVNEEDDEYEDMDE